MQTDKNLPINEHSQYSDYSHLDNPEILKKNFIFGILVILQQVVVCFIYGFLIKQMAIGYDLTLSNFADFSPIFNAFAIYLFVLVGFGLIFSYNKRLVLSGLGFTLLITILTVEWFVLINAFWTKANLGRAGTQFTYDSRIYNIWLSNNDGPISSTTLLFVQRYRSSLVEAVKCGLANSIAFSAILGRGGLFQAFFVALVGTIGYELDRVIIENVGFDYGYTFRLFVYGGFMGLAMGIGLRLRERDPSKSTAQHLRYTASMFSSGLSLLGTAFIFVLFPLIVMDFQPSALNASDTLTYIAPITILYAISASTLSSISMSIFIHQKLMVRDLILGPIAGGIAVASSSFYITMPAWTILVGSVAGLIQPILNEIQRRHIQKQKHVITTVSFALFGVQGIIGAGWSACWRAVILTRSQNITYTTQDWMVAPALQFASGAIAAGIGIGAGIITCIFIVTTAKHERADHFDDYAYWEKDDGIRYAQGLPVVEEQVPQVVVEDSHIAVKEMDSRFKGKNAYL